MTLPRPPALTAKPGVRGRGGMMVSRGGGVVSRGGAMSPAKMMAARGRAGSSVMQRTMRGATMSRGGGAPPTRSVQVQQLSHITLIGPSYLIG